MTNLPTTTASEYVDKKYREGNSSIFYVENGVYTAVKTVAGFGSSPEEALRNLLQGLEWRDANLWEPRQ